MLVGPDSYKRAAASAVVWAVAAGGLGMVLGADVEVMDILTDAGIMGASALGADVVHNAAGWVPTGITSAAATGAMYAGIQRAYRGDDSYITNFVAAAANDVLVEYAAGMMA